MAPSRRRKAKNSGGVSRSSVPTQLTGYKENNNDATDDKNSTNAIRTNNSTNTSIYTSNTSTGTSTCTGKTIKPFDDENSSLVLTSEKRRGIYECDYCHSDISQQPRIRCAVCSDFDLCLDCFITSDHSAMMSRIKAATQTQTELKKDGINCASIFGVAISSAAANHEDHHCYRVCDSTRYPLFPVGRVPVLKTAAKVKVVVQNENDKQKSNDKAKDMMLDLEREHKNKNASVNAITSPPPSSTSNVSFDVALSEDPKVAWTAEEDLRLIDAIQTHGLGNWVDIAEAIGGEGSVGKSPKRCMERYLDDFLGRYGHILPQWTIIDGSIEKNDAESSNEKNDFNQNSIIRADASVNIEQQRKTNELGKSQYSLEKKTENMENLNVTTTEDQKLLYFTKPLQNDEELSRSSKRRNTSAGIKSINNASGETNKKLKVASTELLSKHVVWDPYLPPIPGAETGKEVARDLSCKAEQAFVKCSLAASSKEEADKIRQEWMDNKLNRIGSPTVLPPRPSDSAHLNGSELAGYMPRRGDFDVEWENDAEAALADMEFIRSDTPEDRKLKLRVLQIYCQKLDEREKRKKFVLNRHLYDYRKYIENDRKLPVDERDLVHRMRLFERFHTPDEHRRFITDILKAKQLRKEIAKLQMYRRIGIRTLAEAEMYELDKDRRQFHKLAQLQKESDAKMKKNPDQVGCSGIINGNGSISNAVGAGGISTYSTNSLWKQYKTNDRNNRRSISRSINSAQAKTAQEHDDGKQKSKKNSNDLTKEAENKKMTIVEGSLKKGAPLPEMPGSPTVQEGALKVDVEKGFDLSYARCRDLLSRKELSLCERLNIYPVQYLSIKKTLIRESLVNGLLDKNSSNSDKRTIVKIDVKRRGNIIDFLVKAGILRVVTPQPPS